MRALTVSTAGAPPAITELPDPTASEGTVLIGVKAAGVNAVDAGIAAGMLAEMLPHQYPLVLGRDAAGIVEAVGVGVEGFAVGDEVVGHVLLAPPVQAGTIAQKATLSGPTLVAKPAALTWEQAAALPLAGAAASQAVEGAEVNAGQTVLVSGATGGVGSYTVQLLAAQGITVIATGTSADAARLRELGATHVIDWSTGDVAEQTRLIVSDGVDALIELANHTADTAPLSAVKPGGVVSTTTGVMGEEAAVTAAGLRLFGVMVAPTADRVGPLVERAASGALQIELTSVLPLEDAASALDAFGAGTARGKTVIRIAG